MHIGFILDGNRRYAKERGLPTLAGHTKGFNKVQKLLEWMKELEVKEISMYCFSIQNFNRTEAEKKYLFDLFRKEAKKLLKDEKVDQDRIKIRFVGRLNLFPEDMQELMGKVMEKTKDYDNYTVNYALGYGGREEIIDTVKEIVVKGEEITEENIQKNLWVPENMDIAIRTSGEFRISNFFIWQANYAEWFFLDKYWPEFEKEDLVRILDEYNNKRKRRFGR